MKPIIVVEGPRNVGKSFLIDSIKDHFKVYKVPFKPWFDAILDSDMNNNIKDSLFYVPFGGEMTLLDMYSKGMVQQNLILDRFFLSNVIFGIQSGRIDKETAYKNAKHLLDTYGHLIKIVRINSEKKADDRNKDEWDIYKFDESNKLYDDVFNELKVDHITFTNQFNNQSVIDFYNLIYGIYKEF